MGYFIRTQIEDYDGEYCHVCEHLETRSDREGCTLYDKILEKKDGEYLRCPTCLCNEKECQEAMVQSQMTTELLIEELKKIDDIQWYGHSFADGSNVTHISKSNGVMGIHYDDRNKFLQIQTMVNEFGKSAVVFQRFTDLKPESILDIFRRLK